MSIATVLGFVVPGAGGDGEQKHRSSAQIELAPLGAQSKFPRAWRQHASCQ